MKPHEEVFRLSIEWLRKTHLDLLTVEKLQDENAQRDIAVFHAQQAVEKRSRLSSMETDRVPENAWDPEAA